MVVVFLARVAEMFGWRRRWWRLRRSLLSSHLLRAGPQVQRSFLREHLWENDTSGLSTLNIGAICDAFWC
jgi:hypothetical protein